jgi:dihydrolipoamide dehydrogenase
MVVGELSVEVDVAVIGSGPGGYVAAIRAAQLGKDVIIIEQEKKVGGICLNTGCIPTKALITSSDYFNALKDLEMMGISAENIKVDISKMNGWKQGIIDKLESGIRGLCQKQGIEILEGRAYFKNKHIISISGQSDVNEVKFKSAIIATGSTPIEIPNFKFDAEKILTSDDAIALKQVPKKIVIIGGGYIGTELGTVYGKLGSEVHILEGQDRLISILDKEIVDIMTKEITKFNVNLHFKSLAKNKK